jgi:hypothetical protein
MEPRSEGTSVALVKDFSEVRALLEGGANLAEAVVPRTRPEKVEQLALFGE